MNCCLSDFLALIADEATDLRNRTEFSVYLRYLTGFGYTIECFVDLQSICDATAETVMRSIISILESRSIDFTKGLVLVTCLVTYLVFKLDRNNRSVKNLCALSKPSFAAGMCICLQEASTTKAIILIIKTTCGTCFLFSPKYTHALREVPRCTARNKFISSQSWRYKMDFTLQGS